MGIYLNPGNEGFKSALRSQIYVDKTGLIEYTNSVLDSEQRYICISRPRRFGKSMAAEMLAAYYGKNCDSRELFQNLKISESKSFEEYMNQCDVLHIDMNTFRHKRDRNTGDEISAKQAVALFHSSIIEELRRNFPNSVAEDDIDLPMALARINEDTGTKFVIIIDEWDTIFREDKLDEEAQRAYIMLLRGLFKDAPSKKFIKLAYLTGILPIKKYGTESALNNFDEFTMVNSDVLTEYVGFTEQEVQTLYDEYRMDFEQAKEWYDGYELGEGLHIYNPKSVVDSIRRKRIGNYWTNTETYEALKNYISMNFDGLKDDITQMLAGGLCKVNPNKFQNDMTSFKSKDDVLTLLIHLGYLAYNSVLQNVYIPNEEVKSEFMNAVEDAGWEYVIAAVNASEELLKATWRGDEETVASGIEKVHMAHTSILTYNDENSLSCVIALAYYNAVKEYMIIREMPAGKGYADMIFLPRNYSDKPPMVVELKWNQSPDGAINQIKSKQYLRALKGYKGEVLLVGINYDKESKTHQCGIERMWIE